MSNSTNDENNSEVIHTLESEIERPVSRRAIAFVCALLLTSGVIAGYIYLRWRYEKQRQAQNPAPVQNAAPAPIPQAMIYLDDAMIKGGQAVIGGTVNNISQETLKSLSVELELTKREGGVVEKKVLPLEPRDLAPGQSGRYTITISRDYRGARLSKLLSEESNEIPFRTAQGAKRPPEKPSPTKTIVVKPKSSKAGEDFINTPDTPIIIK
jgi:hypothetical protein